MFDGGNVRATRRDGFRWVLAIIFVIQIIFSYLLVNRFQKQLHLCSAFKSAKETDQPRNGEYVCVNGDVVTSSPRISEPAFEKDLCRSWKIPEPIMFEAVYTHSVKRGKNTHTITDRTITGWRNFAVRAGAGHVRLRQEADSIYSYHSLTITPRSDFARYSPISTTLRVRYFAPTRLHLLGIASTDKQGEIVLSGEKNKPLIVSEVPRTQLLNETRLALLLTGAALVYFFTTLFVPWKKSLREQIERMPSVCYIFDMTGGPESIALVLFVLYAVGSIALSFFFSGDHQFRADQMTAVLFLGFCMLVHVGRSVEYFYVADKRDGFLYEYSRGFFSLARIRLAPFATLKLWIDVKRGSKGSKSYYLKASVPNGKVFDIGGTGSSEATLIEIKNEFDTFRGNRPDPERMKFLSVDA